MSSKPENVFPPEVGYVYALVNPAWPDVVKIGYAGSPKRRFFSYQTGDPYRAYRMIGWSDVVLDSRAAETAVHARFADRRVEGSREWFRITPEQAIAALNTLRREPMDVATDDVFANCAALDPLDDSDSDSDDVGSSW